MVAPVYPTQYSPSVFSPSSSGRDLGGLMEEHKRRQAEREQEQDAQNKLVKNATKLAKNYFTKPAVDMAPIQAELAQPLDPGMFASPGSTELAAAEPFNLGASYTPTTGAELNLFSGAAPAEAGVSAGAGAGSGAGAGAGGVGAAGAAGISGILAALGAATHGADQWGVKEGYNKLGSLGSINGVGLDNVAQALNPMSYIKDPAKSMDNLFDTFTLGLWEDLGGSFENLFG